MSTTAGQRPDNPQSADLRVCGRLGPYEARLANGPDEIRAAQKVRYAVFRKRDSNEKLGIDETPGLDQDAFDTDFDHLLVIDTQTVENLGVVGTQRLQTRFAKQGFHGLYSLSQFDLEPLARHHAEKCFMELGRSCILPEYRSKRILELLWHGTWDYAVRNGVDVMLGCASFPTTKPDSIAAQLAFVYNTSPAPDTWAVSANGPHRYEIPAGSSNPNSTKKLIRDLPPLIKGYLRLGARFSSQASIDFEFGTTDILVVLPVKDINPRYLAYYGADADRHASGKKNASPNVP